MIEFVMPTREELVDQLLVQRREMASHFEREGWSASARKLLKRLDRLIAKYGG